VVEELKARRVALHLLDLGGDISGNGLSKLFLTIAAAFAEAERDRIRERIGQVKADQKARGRYGILAGRFRSGSGVASTAGLFRMRSNKRLSARSSRSGRKERR
jgi:putative DNA-invertase from lambdoid prophage Rac